MKTQPSYEAVSERKAIPPLSQSRYGDMACETLYVQKHVKRAIIGESEPAARGIEVHQVLASYIDHLVRTRRATDLEVFDALMKGTGDEAREVLEKFRGNHAFDPEKILATELHIALDESFLPIEHPDVTAERRLRFAVWLQEAEKQNTKVLKDLIVKRGPIHYRDENQTEHLAEFVPLEKKFYPYRDAVSILDEWFSTHSDEQGLRDKLTVSGLSSALKAEKRAELA